MRNGRTLLAKVEGSILMMSADFVRLSFETPADCAIKSSYRFWAISREP